jgi:hypothetical protein
LFLKALFVSVELFLQKIILLLQVADQSFHFTNLGSKDLSVGQALLAVCDCLFEKLLLFCGLAFNLWAMLACVVMDVVCDSAGRHSALPSVFLLQLRQVSTYFLNPSLD